MRLPGNCWPTQQQELLLQAGLLDGADAIAAWDEWKLGFEGNVARRDCYRLLPLAYRNLSALGVRGREIEQLKKVYKLTWYRNRMQFNTVSPLLERLHESGIRTMLLKGSSMAIFYYGDMGVRTMTDTDILARKEDVRKALSVLTGLGWVPSSPRWSSPEEGMRMWHATPFENKFGQHVDLHWHPLSWYRQVLVDEIWDRTVALDSFGVRAEAPGPADQLCHILLHGVAWKKSRSVHWVADASTVLRACATSLDWDRLVEQAGRGRFSLTARHALAYLRDTFGAYVPDRILSDVSSLPVSWRERAEFRRRTQSCPPSGAAREMHILSKEYFRFSRNLDFPHTPLGFLRYYQQRKGMSSLFEALLTGVRRAVRTTLGLPRAVPPGASPRTPPSMDHQP